jgi:small-conductance mechanosensitive channel
MAVLQILLQALRSFAANVSAFWDVVFARWLQALAQFMDNAPEVSAFFFDALWQRVSSWQMPDIAWAVFWDTSWRDLSLFWTALQQLWVALFDLFWLSLVALLPSTDTLWRDFLAIVQSEDAPAYITVTVRLIAIYFVLRLVRPVVNRLFARSATPQQRMLFRRGIQVVIIFAFVVSSLEVLDVPLDIFFGAAGVLTLAIGFAAQTSVSNLISGLFLIVERAVELGELIEVDGTTGFVTSIGLVSTRMRTFQNLLVRIPNETMVKAKIINYSRLPIRRIDITVGVAYKEDIKQVQKILFKLVEDNPLALEEPQPLFIFLGFGDSSLDMQLSVWTLSANFLTVRNGMQIAIKEAFDQNGIEIPFPHVTVYTGSETTPFPLGIEQQVLEQWRKDTPLEANRANNEGS